MKQLILEFKNLNNLKVLLDLQTKFQGDKELLDFTINLTKIAKDIRYFVWKIQGDFTDDGQANTIGNLIGKLTNAYRLEIIINSPYFADTGANFLSRGLSKLKNLHILKIKIFPLLGKICKQLSESGIFKIQQSICSMPNLEILHYDISRSYKEIDETQQQYLFRGLPKLSNMVFTIQNDTSVEELNKIFEQEKNQLISVNYGYSIFYNEEIEVINQSFQKLLNLLKQSFYLPYLINIKLAHSDYFERYHQQQNENLILLLKIIKEFSQINNQNILQVIAFNTYIKDHMIMNPFQIFIDLLY